MNPFSKLVDQQLRDQWNSEFRCLEIYQGPSGEVERCRHKFEHKGPHSSVRFNWPQTEQEINRLAKARERISQDAANREDHKVKDYMDSMAPSFEQQIMPGDSGKLLERIRNVREVEAARIEKLRRLETLLMTDPLIREFLELMAEVGL